MANKLRNLTFTLALSAAAIATAAQPQAPDILIPTHQGACVIHGLSNNGKYGVASINPGEDGFSYTVGSVFYDLTGAVPVATVLGDGKFASGANDVTDDGLLVVGSANAKPAICRFVGGEWKWEELPVPNRPITVQWEDMYSHEITEYEFNLDGGEVHSVTSDGKYAVGLARCNSFELYEYPVMWDLTDKSIVKVDSPITDRFGNDENMARYMHVSDDGRYILCYNAFSYEGSIVFVYDRQNKETIYIDVEKNGNSFTPRVEGFRGIEIDGASKAMTSDGHYITGGIGKGEDTYIFRFDVWNKELKIYDDGVHKDATGWSVTKDGLVLGATPSVALYADGLICTDDYLYPFQSLYKDVYGLDLERLGIDVTGKPFLVSDDGRTVVFVISNLETYVGKFKEDIADGIDRINLMSNWSVSPAANTKMTQLQNVTFTFDNPIETDPSKYDQISLLDSKGNVVARPLQNGGLNAVDTRLYLSFSPQTLAEGETYTLSLPEGVCWLKGHQNSVNNPIEVKYQGRANVPVSIVKIDPPQGTSLSSLDLNDNPVQVTFDAPVKMSGTADNRPAARLFIDNGNEPAAYLSLDVDLYTNRLIVYPNSTVYLYKGSEYRIDVPAGVVTDLSGMGPSEAFSVNYTGSYVPQLGDEVYVFQSKCDNDANLLFYEGDKGDPTYEYAQMGFTKDSTPWWYVADNELSTDMAFGSHSCYTDGRQANDWLATRQLLIPDNVPSYLKFQGQSYRKNKEDRLKVYIYTDEVTYNQLTSDLVATILEKGDLVFNERLDPGATEGGIDNEWTDYTVSLEKYKGKKIYICFVNDNKNQSMVMIDNIEVMKEVKGFVTITSPVNVVKLSSAPIRGIVTVTSDIATYTSLGMRLLDASGKEVSSLSATGLSLTAGDTYNFEFPQELPLTLGVENDYTIEYTLDDEQLSYSGTVRDMMFEPVKRVVIEEYTGKDCQFCPLGINAMERLVSLYGEKVVPVVLHAYGNDSKGINMRTYAEIVFSGNTAAPNGRINRRGNTSAPMYRDEAEGKYHMTAADVPGAEKVWQDEVVEEFNELAIIDIAAEPLYGHGGSVSYNVKVKSALKLEDQSVRLLGVLLEDDVYDNQKNSLFNISDPMLGEFGQGGLYGDSRFWYYFDNVARNYWGGSPNGMARLFPTTLESGREYEVEVNHALPSNIDNPLNLKMAFILIDEATGRVINACVAKADVSGIEDVTEDVAAPLEVVRQGNEISVMSAGEVEVAVYTLDGRILKALRADGSCSFSLDGYRGVVIVKAASNGQAVARKLIM